MATKEQKYYCWLSIGTPVKNLGVVFFEIEGENMSPKNYWKQAEKYIPEEVLLVTKFIPTHISGNIITEQELPECPKFYSPKEMDELGYKVINEEV